MTEQVKSQKAIGTQRDDASSILNFRSANLIMTRARSSLTNSIKDRAVPKSYEKNTIAFMAKFVPVM